MGRRVREETSPMTPNGGDWGGDPAVGQLDLRPGKKIEGRRKKRRGLQHAYSGGKKVPTVRATPKTFSRIPPDCHSGESRMGAE